MPSSRPGAVHNYRRMLQRQDRTRSEPGPTPAPHPDPLEQGLLDSPGDALAGAEIQGLVRDIAAAQGLTIRNSALAPVEPLGPRYSKVSTRINLSGGIHQWVDFLAAMGSGSRILFVEDLRIVPVRANHPKNKDIRVTLSVSALKRAPAGRGRQGPGGRRRPRPQGRRLVKRRTVQINLALLGLAALWVTLLAGNRGPFEAERRPDPPAPGAAAASPGAASPASASDAAAIAGHHLFHPDRHNDFPEEATEDAGESLGPAPVLMGTMGIGGQDDALMVSRGSRSSGGLYRRLKVGEALDGYTLLRVEGDRVVMKAGATEVKVSIDDRPRGSGRPARSARPAARPRPRTPAARPSSTGVGSPNRRPAAAGRKPGRAAPHIPPANLPAGTVRDGKRLVIISTPFGDIRRWVEDKPQ